MNRFSFFRSASSREAFAPRRQICTKDLVLGGMFAAFLAVVSQLSIPMPTGVPITIQVFGVGLVGAALGWKLGLLSTVSYILLGAVGLPVFSNFRGGLGILTGLTGGYILAWPLMAVLCGLPHHFSNQKINLAVTILCSLIGLALVELIGGFQWAVLSSDRSFGAIMIYSLTAFVPKDMILTVCAVMVSRPLKRILTKL